MNQIDYMRPSGWKRVNIKDRTTLPIGVPTFKNMERQLNKALRHA